MAQIMEGRLVRGLLTAAMMLLGATTAHAATWSFGYVGSGAAGSFCHGGQTCPPPFEGPWDPGLTFDTISATDGIYGGSFPFFPSNPENTLTRVVLGNVSLPIGGGIDTDVENSVIGSFSATITGGRVVSFDGSFQIETQSWTITPERVTYRNSFEPFFFQVAGATAVHPIPEPATFALLISGFGLIGAMHRRRVASR